MKGRFIVFIILTILLLNSLIITSSYAQLSATVDYIQHVACKGDYSGEIAIQITSGQAPYNYAWSFGANYQSSLQHDTTRNLNAGIYNLTITDALGANTVITATINEPPTSLNLSGSISSNYSGADISCHGAADGSISVSASGGTGPYVYDIGGGYTTATNFTGLSHGTYCITVTDANACTDVQCYTITEPSQVQVTITNITNPSCFAVMDGSITALATGGTGSGYTYIWDVSAGSQTTATASQLQGNALYCVTVYDDNACSSSVCDTLIQPSPLTINITNVTHPYCFGDTTGDISLMSTGGIPPYSYVWSNSSIAANQSNLPSGAYCVTVTDANGCTKDTCIILVDPPPLSVGLSIATTDTLCEGVSVNVTANLTNGTGPYSFQWTSNGVTTFSVNHVYAATRDSVVCVHVTTANGCMDSACITLPWLDYTVDITNPTPTNGTNPQLFAGSSTTLEASTSHNFATTGYQWIGPNLSCNNCANPIASPTNNYLYVVQAMHNLGCIAYDSVQIDVLPNDPTDTIYWEVVPDSSTALCASLPAFLQNSSAITSTYNQNGLVVVDSAGCITYTAQGLAGNTVDTFYIVTCSQLCDTALVYMAVNTCVWPGDANDDGIADNADILPIGLHHGATGATRQNASNLYTCQPAQNWGSTISGMPTVDLKHTDCDGNGIINSLDTQAIVLNWAQTHLRNGGGNIVATGVDIYIDTATAGPGDTLRVPIMLGTPGSVPSNGYGIAFSVNYDQMVVDTGSVYLDFSSSWLGNLSSNMIAIQKDFYATGELQVGMTRIDGQAMTGNGVLAHLNITIKDDVLPKANSFRLHLNISDVTFVDQTGTVIPVTPVPSQVLILATEDAAPNSLEEMVSVYPNPTQDIVTIAAEEIDLEQITILDLTGKVVLTKTINSQNHQLDVSKLTNGLYLLRVTSETRSGTFKLLKR